MHGKLVFTPLGPIVPKVVIIFSASSCDFRQCPWEIRSATAERAGQGELGGCTHPEGANSMAESELRCSSKGLGWRWEGHFHRFL